MVQLAPGCFPVAQGLFVYWDCYIVVNDTHCLRGSSVVAGECLLRVKAQFGSFDLKLNCFCEVSFFHPLILYGTCGAVWWSNHVSHVGFLTENIYIVMLLYCQLLIALYASKSLSTCHFITYARFCIQGMWKWHVYWIANDWFMSIFRD